MRAELRGLYCPDSPDGAVRGYTPEDGEHFAVHVQAFVGPVGLGGEESFDFDVCTPSWLAAQPLLKGFAFPRSTLLLERWDPALVERAIGDLCLRAEGETWDEVTLKLSRFGRWEYEDWREPPHHDPVRGGRSV